MTIWARWHIGRIIAWLGGGVAVLGLAGILLAWSGLYNVAASRGHWAIVEWFLAFGMQNSVELRAMSIKAPPLDSPDLIRLGAGHFHSGCAFCHGAPGLAVSPTAQHMLPSPPHLPTSMRPWSAEELFWIIKHGIKYTGMPGWVALEREDEIWAVVAFLTQIAKTDAQTYRNLALASVELPGQTGKELATVESNQQAAGACARCHGAEGAGPMSALVPVLHGQPRAFLIRSLKEYAEGSRRSGIMQPLAAELGEQDIRRLAEYYARLTSPASQDTVKAESSLVARGAALATKGDAGNGVPACSACHDESGLNEYPRLAGQSAAYMAGQLALWRAGHHTATGASAIMAPIARRLSDEDIAAVTGYYGGLRAGAGKQ